MLRIKKSLSLLRLFKLKRILIHKKHFLILETFLNLSLRNFGLSKLIETKPELALINMGSDEQVMDVYGWNIRAEQEAELIGSE